LPPSLLDQAIVAPAGADRTLRPELVGDPLEDGQVVIIQAAHQTRVDREGNAGITQDALDAFEMSQRLGRRDNRSAGALP
jgi:hypothetical protein